jgi:dihydroorotate dehydrogenase electron transfer subunit
MKLEQGIILGHTEVSGGYRLLQLKVPGIAGEVRPGQFVHIRLPAPADAILRRPFSVFRTQGEELHILYKPVGRGTQSMTDLRAGDSLSLIGPLGNGFPLPQDGAYPLLIAGGYGMAALYLLARACPSPGTAFFGGALETDILCIEEFQALGWDVRTATEDGSLGERGLVTGPLDRWLGEERAGRCIEGFACGPNGMLQAVARRAESGGWRAWVSVDRHMGCGVGACLTCVQKIREPDGQWTWMRVCKEGPIFDSASVLWEEPS